MSMIIVETPKWSFAKYRFDGKKFSAEFVSPLPTPFNYGFVPGTAGTDKMPKDAIILGKKLAQGEEVELSPLGEVRFTDDGAEDNKTIYSNRGRIRTLDKIKIHLFFATYAIFKTTRYLAKNHKLAKCRYRGIELN